MIDRLWIFLGLILIYLLNLLLSKYFIYNFANIGICLHLQLDVAKYVYFVLCLHEIKGIINTTFVC